MANSISKEDFEMHFKKLGEQLKISCMPDFIESVISDYNFFNDKSNFSEKKGQLLKIQQKYIAEPLGYFILFHFARTFLDGIRIQRSIVKTFNQHDITGFELYNNDQKIGMIEVNSKEVEKLSNNYEMLVPLFNELGKSIFPDTFNVNDFITNKE